MALLTVKWLIAIPFLSLGCEAQRTSPISSGPETVANLREIQATPKAEVTPTPTTELTLPNGVKIIPKSIEMSDEHRRYKVDVMYPQIQNSGDRELMALNRAIESMVKKRYQWPLVPPTKEDLRHYAKWPGVYNSVDMNYDILLASPMLLSLYFETYSYGIGAAHSVEESFTLNYDFNEGRWLKLSDVFEPGAEYLKFISQHCLRELSQDRSEPLLEREKLAPKTDNYQKWNLTRNGLRFTFNACEIFSCAAGKKTVEIAYVDLEHLIKWRLKRGN